MLDNANNGSSNFDTSASPAIWQSEWIDELWSQLSGGTYNGIGNVVLDENVAQSEQQVLADIEAIDNMLLGSKDTEAMLADVQKFATKNRFNPGVDPLTGSASANRVGEVAQSLAQVLQYVQSQGLPDLTAEVGELTLNNVALPGEQGRLAITVANQGGLETNSPVKLKIFASQQAELNDSAVEIGEIGIGKLKLKPNGTQTVSAAVELPNNFTPGEYNIFVAVDTDGNVPEANELNNIAVATSTQTVAWQFGNVGDRKNVQLSLTDPDGDVVRFELKGDGYGEVTESQGVKQIALYGTTDKSEVSIQADGDGNVIGTVSINGSLKQFSAQETDLQGGFTITGSLDKLLLDDVSNAQISIGQGSDAKHKVDVEFGQVSNLSLTSQSTLKLLKADSWAGGSLSTISAPELESLSVKGNFDANIQIAGKLKQAKVDGVSSGTWRLQEAEKLDLNSTAAAWTLSVAGKLDKLDVKQDLLGTVAAGSFNRLFVRGDLANAKVLVGTSLGNDGQVGGGDDTYGSGKLKDFIVYGDVLSSVVGAGLNPLDSSFTNGNEQLVAGGVISKIEVRGQVSTDSLFAAETFEQSVKFGKKTIDPEVDSRFLTPSKVVADAEAPIVTLSLVEDTGDATDRITSVATLTGTVTDASGISSLKAGFGDLPVADYVDIFEYLQGDLFTLDATALAAVLGQPITSGTYTLSVIAEDNLGNASEPVSYSYTIDTDAPTLSVTELKTTNTEDGLIRLVGSIDEAVTITVTLNNDSPVNFELATPGDFEQALQVLPTEVGEYELGITIADAAGNTTQTTLNFEVEAEPPTPGGNRAPIFAEIAPLTVIPGQRIEIPLTATDPDGDLVTYTFRSNGKLPNGRLDGAGTLMFEPSPDQIGTYEFTLFATDGEDSTARQVSLTVAPDPDTSTRLSGQILDTNGNPLANMPLALGRLQVLTDADGYFTVTIPQTSFPTERINIEIPFGDAAFDPFLTGTSEIDLRRTTFDGTTGTSLSNPLRHPNLVTTFLDANMVYGSDANRAAALRTNDGTGRLKVSDGDLLPINNSTFFPDGTLTNDNRGLTDPATLFATGDVRANENIALTAVHTVFLREHNRLTDEIKAANPELGGEEIYQRARKLVAAQIQYITYSEYLPLLVGDRTIADYSGYDANVDPSISHLFSAAAFRMGHTQSFDEFLLIGDDGQALPPVSLDQSTFNPALVQQYGVDAILRGLFAQSTQAIDTKVIGELRNTLFGPPGSGGIDLAAVDIQHGRDVGLPDYNQARVDFGLAPVTSFAEITSDVALQAVLAQVYGDVNEIDAIVGGLAEDAVAGSMVGEFFQTVIADQFARLRDGDRFWYENGQFTNEELSFIRGTSLSALLARNTEITGLANNVFSTGRDPVALGQGGTVATQTVTEYAALDGSNNNLGNSKLGTPGTNLRVDYTQEYGDGIRTLAGEGRANVRDISNAIFTQDESIPDATGATGFMLAWSQFLGHDMALSPAGAADTLKVYGTQYESATGEVFPFIAEKLNLLLGHEVYAGVNNVIERPIYLPALAIEDNVQVVKDNGDFTVTNASLGAKVFVAANSLLDRRGNPFDGQLTISEVPPELTPAALPNNLLPSMVVTIQPGDMVFNTPARLTLPNRAGWTPGQTMDLWSINPTTGDFDKVGTGRVSANGEVLETISGGIRNSSWHFIAPRPPVPEPPAPPEPEGHELEFTSVVNPTTGAVIENHKLAGYQSMGEERGLRIVYDSLRADARPVVETYLENLRIRDGYVTSKVVVKAGNIDYQVPGVAAGRYGLSGGENIWKLDPASGGGKLQTAVQVDLRTQSSGRYNYDLTLGGYQLVNGDAELPRLAGSSATTERNLIHVNSIDSQLGSGWGIAGLQEIVENSDGSALLIDGDGTEAIFERAKGSSGQYQSSTGDFSILEKLEDGTFIRTTKEKTVYRFNSSNHLVSVTDRNNNVTRYEYDSDRLLKVIDPVGLETVLTYSVQGKVSSIENPTGSVTRFSYDAAGNLVGIQDPDATQRKFEYDSSHHMTAEVDKNGARESAIYDFSGRAVQAIQKDGTTVFVNPLQTQGLVPPGQTRSLATAPLARANTGSVVNFIDGNGQESITEIGTSGQVLTRDGDNVSVVRNGDGLVSQSFDKENNATTYEYDSNGNLIGIMDSLSGSGTSESSSYGGGDVREVIVADFNQDGFDDVATSETDTINVYFSNGDKSFAAPVSLSLPGYFQRSYSEGDLLTADVNQDGFGDILAIDQGSQLTTLLGSSNGEFSRVISIGNFHGTHLVDIDGDDALDLFDLDYGEWFRGSGKGAFESNANYFGNSVNRDLQSQSLRRLGLGEITIADDFDGDGDLDVVTVGDGYSGGLTSVPLRVLLNTGNETWWTNDDESLMIEPVRSMFSYDLDLDQDADLVVLDEQNNLHVYTNNGNGVFSEEEDISPFLDEQLLGDGRGRRVVAAQTGEVLGTNPYGYGLNDGYFDSDFASFYDFIEGPSINSDNTAFGDIDGDGDLDLVVEGGGYGSYNISVVTNEGNGNWQTASVRTLSDDESSFTDGEGSPQLVDLNQDGLLDIVASSSNGVYAYFGKDGSQFSKLQIIDQRYLDSDHSLEIVDVNRDARLDIAITNGSTLSILLANEAGGFNLADESTNADFSWNSLIAGRFDDNPVADYAGVVYNNTSYLKELSIGFDLSSGNTDTISLPDSGRVRGRGQKNYGYDETFNQLTLIHDELGEQTLYELDEFGNRTAEIKVVGTLDSLENGEVDDIVTGYSYTQGGLIDEITNPDGQVTKHLYDAYGRLTQISYDFGTANATALTYEYEAGNVASLYDAEVDAEGVRTEYEYDGLNRITQITVTEAGNSAVTSYEYDAMGNTILEADADGELRNAYDEKGRIETITYKDGSTSGYEYDGNGNRTKMFENGELAEENAYDARDLLIRQTNSRGQTTEYAYDANGQLSESNDGRERITYVRDARGRVVEKLFDDALADTSANQNSVALSRSQGLSESDSSIASFSARSSLVEAQQNTPKSERMMHDETDKLIAKVGKDGSLTEFFYDQATYQPKMLKFSDQGLETGLTYKEFEKDKKTTHKPITISGEFGSVSLSYTNQGTLKKLQAGSIDAALMDVFAAALGAKTHTELIDMLSYKGKEILEPDPCVKDKEKPEEDKMPPPDGVMDAWERLSVIAINPNSGLADIDKGETVKRLNFERHLIESVADSKSFSNYIASSLILKEVVELGVAYASLIKSGNNQPSQSDAFFLDLLWSENQSTANRKSETTEEWNKIYDSFSSEERFRNFIDFTKYSIKIAQSTPSIEKNSSIAKKLAIAAKSYADSDLDINLAFTAAKNNKLDISKLDIFQISGLYALNMLNAEESQGFNFTPVIENTVSLSGIKIAATNKPDIFDAIAGSSGTFRERLMDIKIAKILFFDPAPEELIDGNLLREFVGSYPNVFRGEVLRFMDNYLSPNPIPDVDLANWGLLPEIQSFLPVLYANTEFRDVLIPAEAERAVVFELLANNQSSINISSRRAYRGSNGRFEYIGEYAKRVDFLWHIFGIGDTLFQRNFDLNIEILESKQRSIVYVTSGTLLYGIDDTFDDAADKDDNRDGLQEYDGGTGYAFHADWTEPYYKISEFFFP